MHTILLTHCSKRRKGLALSFGATVALVEVVNKDKGETNKHIQINKQTKQLRIHYEFSIEKY